MSGDAAFCKFCLWQIVQPSDFHPL